MLHLRALSGGFAAACLLSATILPAQDFIHYRFESGCTNEVVNYASGASAHPVPGMLDNTTGSSPWTAGQFGQGLAGGVSSSAYNRVRTGWDPSVAPVNGDLTIAWFSKHQQGSPTSTYLMGNTGGFRLFTTGIAGRGLYQRLILASGGNGTNASIANDFYLPDTVVDFQAMAATGWVHVAIVVDATAQTADWYINGKSVLQLQNVVGGAQINATGEFTLGQWSSSTSGYAMDEFFMARRALTAPEILVLSLSPRAGHGPFASGIPGQCGNVTLSATGGTPSIGNSVYGLLLSTPASGSYALILATNRCTLGGSSVQLPFDLGVLGALGQGCWLLGDPLLTLPGGVGGVPLPLPVPIPSDPTLAGLSLWAQAVLYDAVAGRLAASRGWAMTVGS